MADDFLNIDLVFRNGLKDYEALPPDSVWNSVQTSLAGKKDRSLRLLLARAASVAVLTASAGTLLWFARTELSKEIKMQQAITLNQEQIPEGRYVTAQPVAIPGDNTLHFPDVITPPASQEEQVQNGLNQLPGHLKTADLATDFKTENRFLPLAVIQYKSAGETGFAEKENKGKEFTLDNIDLKDNEQVGEKWKLGAAFLPAYYSKFSFGSDDAAKEYIKEEDLAFSYSGGLSVAFNVSRRLSVQAGMVLNNMGQKIEGLTSYSGFIKYSEAKSGSDFAIRTASGTINSVNKDIFFIDSRNISRVLTMYTSDIFDPVKADLRYVGNSVIQNLKYLELPVSLHYKLIDRTVDISMSGGISYNILVGNNSYVQSEGVKYMIGKTTGLSPVTFSSSLGLGMEYKLSSSMTLSVEPVFRYYITPLGGITGSSIHPYSFGVMSGFFYNF
ncbi:MAG: outer membrane beta-barrel protein [Bacteroidales bacterium]|nr:outer membrane beta-barrel protein [Bacteroidales bacterium]